MAVQLFISRALIAIALVLLAQGTAFIAQVHVFLAAPGWIWRSAPYAVLLLGLLLSFGFNRSRIFFSLITLLGAHAALHDAVPRSETLLLGVGLLTPCDLLAWRCLPERGIFSRWGVLSGALLFAQALALAGVLLYGGGRDYSIGLSALPIPWEHFHSPPASVAASGMAALGLLGFCVFGARAEDFALLLAATSSFVAFEQIELGAAYVANLLLAGLALSVAVILSSYTMAYRDELTGLPARRALNERLAALGRRYVIAMCDVDHFKQFNDTYGHDTGDQVLKMVASQLRRVGGGGRAYRYGGEEFCIVFPRARLEACVPHLESLRAAIAAYTLTLRGPKRPTRDRRRKRRPRKPSSKSKTVNVSISIGAAARSEEHKSPDGVLAAADAALYRAKQQGRNRVIC